MKNATVVVNFEDLTRIGNVGGGGSIQVTIISQMQVRYLASGASSVTINKAKIVSIQINMKWNTIQDSPEPFLGLR